MSHVLGPVKPAEDGDVRVVIQSPGQTFKTPLQAVQLLRDISLSKILITGGAGRVGVALASLLLEMGCNVNLLDVDDSSEQLQTLLKAYSSERLSFFHGDVRDRRLVVRAIDGVSGVVHMGVTWGFESCEIQPAICRDVNVNGIAVLFQAMQDVTSPPHWLVFRSSFEVFTASKGPVVESTPPVPINLIGKVFADAETLYVNSCQQWHVTTGSSLSCAVVRFPLIYGSTRDPSDDIVPSLVRSALSHQPMIFNAGTESLDLLHFSDAAVALKEVIARIQSLPSGKGEVQDYNVGSGTSTPLVEVIGMVRAFVDSPSPIQIIPPSKQFLISPNLIADIEKTRKDLDFKPKVSLHDGVYTYVSHVLNQTVSYLSNAAKNCSMFFEPDPTSLRIAATGCTFRLYVRVPRAFEASHGKVKVKGQAGIGLKPIVCQGSAFKVSKGNSYYASVVRFSPPVKTTATSSNMPLFNIQCGTKFAWSLDLVQQKKVGLTQRKDTLALWQLEKDPWSHSVALALVNPQSPESRRWLTLNRAGKFVISGIAANRYVFRISPLCCPAKEGTPFSLPLLSSDPWLEFHRFPASSQPFVEKAAAVKTEHCRRVSDALAKAKFTFTRLRSAEIWKAVKDETARLDSVLGSQIRQVKEGRPWISNANSAGKWSLADWPVCENDCSHPTVCVNTGWCRCVRAEYCPSDTARVAAKDAVALWSQPGGDQSQVVAVPPIESVMLPAARLLGKRWPNVHVVHLDSKLFPVKDHPRCYKLHKRHCFSADHITYTALRNVSVETSKADLFVVPFYHGCMDVYDYLKKDGKVPPLGPLMDQITEAVRKLSGDTKGARTVWGMTHDWGGCGNFHWDMQSLVSRDENRQMAILANSYVLQSNGDYSTNCHKPHKDVVIPARTCNTHVLWDHYRDRNSIKPVLKRKLFVFFAGSSWQKATGHFLRARIMCPSFASSFESSIIVKSIAKDKYINGINDAVFCLAPRGTTGFADRLQDIIWAGCIPVMLSDGTAFPYADLLDWQLFSVRVDERDFARVPEILKSVPKHRLQQMQANVLAVREAFLYAADGKALTELQRTGPVDMTMRSLALRLLTVFL
eukprot:CAMPEP_0184643804 /NCGR_PEP_ID=MMETSP0308-20130426/629_1 /TAXON_ID=38269 /ORGANISM="Gloeochaete witrockiana, Strain SAG 46.84" /LENGTH=1088 /DNA_ID=CAMNT_0027071993 /DNA_START=157 /DNA_END=3423 /DNA_ORIENTATION=-